MGSRVIAIEGTLGAGKTTLIEKLTKRYQLNAITEPVKEWTKSGLLQNYYDNPKQYAVTLQEAAYDSFKAKKIHGYGLQERSIYSAYYVFTALMYWRKHINQEQFRGLTKNFMEILPETEPIEAIIYLRLPESTALERIKL